MAVVRSKVKDVPIPDEIRSFPEFVLKKFAAFGDLTAIVDSATDRSFTYEQICTLSRKCGSALVKQGVQAGDTLAIILPNMIEYPVILYGVMSIGGIATTLNPQYTVRELLYQLNDSHARYVITVPDILKKVKEAARQSTRVRRVFVFGDVQGEVSFEKLMLNDDGSAFRSYVPGNWKDEVALLPYSSGTTGLQKGVMLTHYNLISFVTILTDPSRLEGMDMETIRREVGLVIIPMFHIYGSSITLGAIMCLCVKLVTMKQFEPVAFLRAIQDYKVTRLNIVPPLFLFLAKHPSVLKFDLSSVVRVGCGAAPLGEGLIDELKSRMPNVTLISQGYGLTEVSGACMVCPENLDKPACVGEVLPNLEAKVIDLKSGKSLPANKEGEICVRGPIVMKGYLNKPKETAITIDKDGWLHTGDIGYYDDHQHFYIVGRVKELIKYKGFQVAPAELEDLLQTHPSVSDAAVVGIPDTVAGELPRAFVVLKSGSHGVTSEEIAQFVSRNVSRHKRLRGGVEFIKSIPKNPSGKIMRRQLKEKAIEEMKLKHKL